MMWLQILMFPNAFAKLFGVLFLVSIMLSAWCAVRFRHRFRLSFLWTFVWIMVLALVIDYVLVRVALVLGTLAVFAALAFCATAVVYLIVGLSRRGGGKSSDSKNS